MTHTIGTMTDPATPDRPAPRWLHAWAVLTEAVTLVLLVLGAATAFFGESCVCVPALAVHVIEPVGAGDAFAAGFLAGLLRGESAERCLRVGHVTAASALSVTGDHGPLPDEAEIGRLLGVSAEVWSATRRLTVNSRSRAGRRGPRVRAGRGESGHPGDPPAAARDIEDLG